jgi:recombination protein RecT
MAAQEKSLSVKSIVDRVSSQIASFEQEGRLKLPPNYSAQNALMSAWLQIQSIKDKNDRPVLEVCTQASIANALLDMVIQGLSPAKKQCYFIPFGNQLVLMRSYFGTASVVMSVLKTTKPPIAACIYEGDEFEYVLEGGNKKVTKHVQSFANVKKDKIIGAYCTIYPPGHEPFTEIMTIEQIHQAWKQSRMNPFDKDGNLNPNSTHGKFTDQMAMKTVINRACKMFINSSDDSTLDLVVESFNRSEEAAEEAAFQEEVEKQANQEVIDVDYEIKEDDPREEIAESEEPAEEPATKEPAKQASKRRGPDW